MFIGLKHKNIYIDSATKVVTHIYSIEDTNNYGAILNISFYENSWGGWDNIRHMNDLLYAIYDHYKYSKYCTKTNFNLALKNTFSKDESYKLIINTKFYKLHRKLFEGFKNA